MGDAARGLPGLLMAHLSGSERNVLRGYRRCRNDRDGARGGRGKGIEASQVRRDTGSTSIPRGRRGNPHAAATGRGAAKDAIPGVSTDGYLLPFYLGQIRARGGRTGRLIAGRHVASPGDQMTHRQICSPADTLCAQRVHARRSLELIE